MKNGWISAELSKYVNFIDYRGRTPVKTESGITLITAKNVKLGYLSREPQEFIAEDNYESWMTRGIPNVGDVIFTTEAPLANVAQIDTDEKLAFAQRIIVMQPDADILTQSYLKYLLLSKSVRDDILSKGTGATVKGIKSQLLKKVIIPIAPLQEQQQIVEKLDQAFELIDQAKANIEQNIINAKELFQSKLDEVFTNNQLGWELKKLSDLCNAKDDIVGGPFGSNLKVEHYRDNGIPILRLQNIGKGYFINKDIKFIEESKAEELSYHSFRKGDIALAKLGIPIGKTCIIPDEFDYGIVVADVVRIRPKNNVDKSYLVYFLNSNTAVKQLTKNIKGATRPRVNLPDVRNMEISIPEYSEQINVSKYIFTIENHINDIINRNQQKLDNIEEIRKSILEKAFRGELTN